MNKWKDPENIGKYFTLSLFKIINQFEKKIKQSVKKEKTKIIKKKI